ncbi:glycosyltransferase family 2 protein [Lapidilactobacillus gannanensis]|uniref:Glycosyltransferase family 2 protein n=1 Tax=Lapidilactobacillus gannanensis TaxID=2486002 RepID=A0ABW4BNF8_9LACO|nr:glycosyltransferase family 2 protein [Lapidilactobacillus gannanensis]
MISVCMATYNGANSVKRQLDSILEQLPSGSEIVIVDDGSTDTTLEITTNLQGTSTIDIRVFVNKTNMGPIKSFEKALSFARGDYIFLSDQDDIWLSNKVSEVMQAFHQGADLVVHDGIVVDGDLKVIDQSWNHYNHNELNQGIVNNILRNGYTGAMMAISKSLVHLALPFPNDIPMHDQWLFAVAKLNKLKVTIIDEPLMQYVRHGNNVTGMKKRRKIVMLQDRLTLIKLIVKYRLNRSH